MYHVEMIDVTPSDSPFNYRDTTCLFANNMGNTSNYYIRNLMTGLKKAPETHCRSNGIEGVCSSCTALRYEAPAS